MATRAKVVKQLTITHRDAAILTGLPTGKLLRWAKSGTGGFPAPVRIVERTYLFNREAVERWAAGRPAGEG